MITDPIGRKADLCPGTIVSFRFPLAEGEGLTKARPCLVIGSNSVDGAHRITLAYGTSADSDSNRGLDLALAEPADWMAAGLHRPTRFVLMRRITVGLDDPRFNLHRRDGPVIGALPAMMLTTLQQMCRWLGARMVEDRRQGAPRVRAGVAARRAMRPAGQQTPVAAVVEHRRHRRSAGRMPEGKHEGRPGNATAGCLPANGSTDGFRRPEPSTQRQGFRAAGHHRDHVAKERPT